MIPCSHQHPARVCQLATLLAVLAATLPLRAANYPLEITQPQSGLDLRSRDYKA